MCVTTEKVGSAAFRCTPPCPLKLEERRRTCPPKPRSAKADELLDDGVLDAVEGGLIWVIGAR